MMRRLPAYRALDEDGDGALSADEISRAPIACSAWTTMRMGNSRPTSGCPEAVQLEGMDDQVDLDG